MPEPPGADKRDDEPCRRALRLRPGARARELPERRGGAPAREAVARPPRLCVPQLREPDRVVRQRPRRLLSPPAGPLPELRRALLAALPRGRAPDGSARRGLLPALWRERSRLRGRLLLRRPRRSLRDRLRAAHPAERHRPAVSRGRPRRAARALP